MFSCLLFVFIVVCQPDYHLWSSSPLLGYSGHFPHFADSLEHDTHTHTPVPAFYDRQKARVLVSVLAHNLAHHTRVFTAAKPFHVLRAYTRRLFRLSHFSAPPHLVLYPYFTISCRGCQTFCRCCCKVVVVYPRLPALLLRAAAAVLYI